MEGRGHFQVSGISATGEKPSVSFGQGTEWVPAPVSFYEEKKSPSSVDNLTEIP